jgi:hypothetical protein
MGRSMKAFPASWAMLVCAGIPLLGQAPARLPRTPDGKPDLNGVWQALNTASTEGDDYGGLGAHPHSDVTLTN